MSRSILLVGKYSVIEPLGLMSLISVIRNRGHRVGIYLLKDENDSDLMNIVHDYEVVGFSIYTGFHKVMLRKAEILKKDFKVIIGGPHTTHFGEQCKKNAHYVVIGEGFNVINEILEFKVKEGIVFNPNMVSENNLPKPDRETLYKTYPEFADNKIKSIIVSINCPFDCHHCFNSSYKKLYPNLKVRQKSVGQAIEECLEIKQYPLDLIYFQDDCFGFNLDWLKEFSIKYKDKINVPFHCQIRPEMVTPYRLDLLKVAGCQGITMAIETFREDIRRDLLNRKMTNEQIMNSCSMIRDRGFKLRTEQMLGIPETFFEDEINLLKMNVDINPNMAWTSIYAPYLGTVLGDYCKEMGLYSGDNDDLSDNFFHESQLNFDTDRLKKTNLLHKIFATCAKFPNGHLLAKSFLDDPSPDFQSWFFKVKEHLFEYTLYSKEEL